MGSKARRGTDFVEQTSGAAPQTHNEAQAGMLS